MKSWQAVCLAVAVVGGIVALAWLGMRSPVPAKVAMPGVPQKVQPAPAEKSFACRVMARETVAATGSVTGAVDRVLVDVGMAVVEGQVLAVIGKVAGIAPLEMGASTAVMGSSNATGAQIAAARRESAELQASVARLRVRATAARLAFEKQELLNRAGVTPRLVFENARMERDRVAADLAATEEASRLADNTVAKLEDLKREQGKGEMAQQRAAAANAQQAAIAEVHAPVAGVVVERNISAGDLVTNVNRNALFRIAEHPELLRAEFIAMPLGTAISIHVADVTVGGTVAETGTSADFESRTAVILPGSACTITLK